MRQVAATEGAVPLGWEENWMTVTRTELLALSCRELHVYPFENESGIINRTIHEKLLCMLGLSGSRSKSFLAERSVAAKRMACLRSSVMRGS